MEDIEKSINNHFKDIIYNDTSLVDDNLKLKVWKQQDLRFSLNGSHINCIMPLKIWVETGFRKKILGATFQQNYEANGAITLDVSIDYHIQNDWSVITSTKINDYTWTQKPTVKVAGTEMPITFISNIILKSLQKKIDKSIDEAIEKSMSLVRTIATVRPDIRGITNFLLSKIEPIAHHFIPVNPFEKSTSNRSSLPGLRIAKNHLKEGHPLFFFPSGQVSKIVKWFRIADREWQLPTVKLIQKSQVPIIPVYFEGHNSWKFLLVGLIHPILRTALIPAEVKNKRGKKIRLRIGEPISVEEQKLYPKPEDFGRFLYRKTYELKQS